MTKKERTTRIWQETLEKLKEIQSKIAMSTGQNVGKPEILHRTFKSESVESMILNDAKLKKWGWKR